MTPTLRGPWDGTPSVRITRWYEASREEVFRAFTDPHLLRQWWTPRDFVVEDIDFAARAGSTYLVRLRAPDGTRFAHTGRILEVTPPSALVYSWRWIEGPLDGADTLVELHFVEERGGVVIHLAHSKFANQAEADKHVGWLQAFDALEAWLPSQRAGEDPPRSPV